jgi:ketosteroid isomerase-like protein
MKKAIIVIAIVSGFLFSAYESQAQQSSKADIEKLIFSYQDALNDSNAEKVVSLYTAGGVLLANAAPSAIGTEQLLGTYKYVFENFTYNLKFTIDEIVINGNSAYGRSTSKGSFIIKSSGQTVQDENRELFVFEKDKGDWKIARYMYNKSK